MCVFDQDVNANIYTLDVSLTRMGTLSSDAKITLNSEEESLNSTHTVTNMCAHRK